MNAPHKFTSTAISVTVIQSVQPPRRQGFDRGRLPDPLTYYATELDTLRGHGRSATARCPFHDDRHPSLSVNLDTGAFRCRVPACGAHGRDVLAFHMARYGIGFIAAAKALGAWSATR